MGTPVNVRKHVWQSIKYDSSKIVAAPTYEPMKMKPLAAKPHPRQAEMDANRAIKSLKP